MSEVQPTSATEEYEERWADLKEKGSEYYTPEKYQLGIVMDFLDSQDVTYITEGQVYCYPIDILAEHRGKTMAIELKSGDIARGIEQARRNADFVDHSFLSIWESDVTDELLEEVSDLPIGLIGVDTDVQIYSSPSTKTERLCDSSYVIDVIEDNVRSKSPVQ